MADSFNTPAEAYEWLKANSKETSYFHSMGALLHWDQRTVIPARGHEHRTRQLAALAKLLHSRSVDPLRGKALQEVEHSDLMEDPLSEAAVNVREWRRSYERTTKIPERLAVELAAVAAEAETVWEQSRPENDWKSFKPHLEKLLELKKEEAEVVGYENEAYDALLDEFEPGITAKELEPLFQNLQFGLTDLVKRIAAAEQPDSSILRGEYPVDMQKHLVSECAQALGFSFQSGVLAVSAHPFSTSIGPGDVRITTRFKEEDFTDAFFSAVHEVGHSLYESGLPAKHWGTPRGEAVSFGIHESQSRMWENFVARSASFWKLFLPKAQALFPFLKDVDPESFLRAVNRVEPGLIRVDADEVTYNLHVLVRFQLEAALFRNEIGVDDMPAFFDEKMEQYLSVRPPDYKDGVMQDVHWSGGAFGYFPSYTLGNLYAAQFFAAFTKEYPGYEKKFASGEFGLLLRWLRETIHSKGMTYRAADLVKEITGEEPDQKYLLEYLNAKFGALYKL